MTKLTALAFALMIGFSGAAFAECGAKHTADASTSSSTTVAQTPAPKPDAQPGG